MYTRTVKPYDILRVKNALVKSVYCVTECAIGCPVTIMKAKVNPHYTYRFSSHLTENTVILLER
jgi:hypothetical protein